VLAARRHAGACLLLALFAWPPVVSARDGFAARVAVAAVAGDAVSGRPELASSLVERLQALCPVVVLGPGSLVEPLDLDARSRAVRRVAFAEALDAVVLGRLVPVSPRHAGPGFVLELHVRSGHSGGVVQREQVLLPPPPSDVAAIDAVLERIVAAQGWADAGPRVASGLVSTGGSVSDHGGAGGLFALDPANRDQPVEIESDELELRSQDDGSRHLVFTNNVRIVQGEATLTADELEAFYPPRESSPSLLIARGNVVVRQLGRTARCEEATYRRSDEKLLCRGNAELSYGCDIVRGREIEFDLAREGARVVGAASVLIRPRGEVEGSDCLELPR
jgi:lipopolysaccharide transport protein LptA